MKPLKPNAFATIALWWFAFIMYGLPALFIAMAQHADVNHMPDAWIVYVWAGLVMLGATWIRIAGVRRL